MKRLPLKFETEALNRATMVREIRGLDCIVCPCLRVEGGKYGVVLHCEHELLCVPVRFRKHPIVGFDIVPKWCPRKKAMLRNLEN